MERRGAQIRYKGLGSGSWDRRVSWKQIDTTSFDKKRLDEGLGRALAKLYKGRQGYSVYQAYQDLEKGGQI